MFSRGSVSSANVIGRERERVGLERGGEREGGVGRREGWEGQQRSA